MIVAICFFGITRSLKYTINSIEEHIINVLNNNNIEFKTFMHTYQINSTYINKRTKEKCENVDNTEYKLLNPNYIKIDDQDTIKKNLNLKHYRTHPDPWDTGYSSVNNYILGQYSKLQVTKLLTESEQVFDYVLYVRPDCL